MKYESPILEVVTIDVDDVITTSDIGTPDPDTPIGPIAY